MTAATPFSQIAVSHASTKQLLLNGLIWMLGLTALGLFTVVVRFETHHGEHQHQPLVPDRTIMVKKNKINTLTTGAYARTASPKDTAFHWNPLSPDTVQCGPTKDGGIWLDPFPESFDAEYYKKLHGEDYDHYVKIGRKKGLECTKGQRMKEIFNQEILPQFETYIQSLNEEQEKLILEIGPFLSPMVIGGDNVKYFDLMDLEGLKERAKAVNYPEVHPVNITYVNANGNLGTIPDRGRFLLVASSNVLPNQLDLIRHLQDVDSLLVDGGYYAMTMADKRYMFDHFLPETDIAAVLDDHLTDHRRNGVHRLRSLLEHRALTAHNEINKHWAGVHGTQYSPNMIELLQNAQTEYQSSIARKEYVDVHNYHFSPQNLAFLIDTLFKLEFIDLKVHRVYDTVAGAFEFGIVLQKCKAVTSPAIPEKKHL